MQHTSPAFCGNVWFMVEGLGFRGIFSPSTLPFGSKVSLCWRLESIARSCSSSIHGWLWSLLGMQREDQNLTYKGTTGYATPIVEKQVEMQGNLSED